MPARKFPAWLDTLILASATGGLTIAAALVMFSTFMFYDDEGYVLISLLNFASHGGLYRDVYTQYGPFPFVLYAGLQGLGIPLTHTVGRVIALGAWAGTAWSCAVIVGYTTRNLLVRIAVLAAVFVYLWVMASEPTHPGGLIVFLTSVLAVLGYRWISQRQELLWAILAGGGAAILFLTKINIGIFVAFSMCSWLLLNHRVETVRRWAPAVVSVWGIMLPLVLMRPLLGVPWVQSYALVFACSAVAVVVALPIGAGRVGWRTLGAAAAAAAAVVVVVLGVVLLRGTQPQDLLEGMLLGPLRQPIAFSLGFVWPPGIRVIAVASALVCVGAWTLRRRGVTTVDFVIAVLRLLAALALAIDIALYPNVIPEFLAFGMALPCLWFFVWPLPGEDPTRSRARAWLALLLLGQSLHVFPVPGSQIAWGTVLVIPLAAIGAWEAATWLAQQRPNSSPGSRCLLVAGSLAVAGFAAVFCWSFAKVAGRYREGANLRLPGAEIIRLPEYNVANYRILTQNAVAHADMLFSLPGMFSYNMWTGLPTPTYANVTHWFSLLDGRRQQAIMRELETHPRACVIVHTGHIKFLADRNLAPKGPLYDYIMSNFEPVFGFDEVEFRVHRGRRIAPILVGELYTLSSDANADRKAESTLLKLALPGLTGKGVASIQLSSQSTGTHATLGAGNARLEIAQANLRGEPVGPAQPAAWPARIDGPCILSVYYRREEHPPFGPGAIIELRDASGAEVALARLGL